MFALLMTRLVRGLTGWHVLPKAWLRDRVDEHGVVKAGVLFASAPGCWLAGMFYLTFTMWLLYPLGSATDITTHVGTHLADLVDHLLGWQVWESRNGTAYALSRYCATYECGMALGAYAIASTLVVALWWALTCLSVQLMTNEAYLPKSLPKGGKVARKLQLIGAYAFVLITFDLFCWAGVLWGFNAMYGYLPVPTLAYYGLVLLSLAYILLSQNWILIVKHHAGRFKYRWIPLLGVTWAVVLYPLIGVYLWMVHATYVQIQTEDMLSEGTVITLTFLIALNVAIFTAIQRLYRYTTKVTKSK